MTLSHNPKKGNPLTLLHTASGLHRLLQTWQGRKNSSSTRMQLLRIRTVTSFLTLSPTDFDNGELMSKVAGCSAFLRNAQETFTNAGYEVQTVRIATNPFGEYLSPVAVPSTTTGSVDCLLLERQLKQLNEELAKHNIDFCALGPARTLEELSCCPFIVSSSHRLSCSADVASGTDVEFARGAAECMQKIANLGDKEDAQSYVIDGLGNFRFCATACCMPYTPFFPAARGESSSQGNGEDFRIAFSIGLENGKLAHHLLKEAGSLDNIKTIFKKGMEAALEPIQAIAEDLSGLSDNSQSELPPSDYKGIDTSLNPSLDENGSVANAMEQIDILKQFGGRGSLAVAAELTRTLKSLSNIKIAGYSGLMLPVCEDARLAELASSRLIDTTHLLGISSVCGVGLDTIPVGGNSTTADLMGLILDVAALAFRYDKSLSCRLLLCPGKIGGDKTSFNSPYMCECKIFSL